MAAPAVPAWARPVEAPISPRDALTRVVYLMDRSLAPGQKIRAFRNARDVVDEVAALRGPDELARLHAAGKLTDLPGIGASTAAVIGQALAGEVPDRIRDLEASTTIELTDDAVPYRSAIRGDCHLHSDWSDGGAPIRDMALAAMALGHEWMVLTDHSGRLTVAHGLNRDRLAEQLGVVEDLNAELAPFRILTGMEVDILEDGALDMDADMLARLDVVVASVHSKLRMDGDAMTRRMLLAIADPNVDILGHCTGRKLSASGEQPASDSEPKRPPSDFDAKLVFAACAKFDTAVEINCRPERQDPPDELLELALDFDCTISIDTDAHAPGQLEWQAFGCDKAARHDIEPEVIVNTWDADRLIDWAASHPAGT